MDILKFIKSRRSVRKYTSKQIPDRVLYEILEAGRWAPCAGNIQNSRFVIIKDSARRREVANACLEQEWIDKNCTIKKPDQILQEYTTENKIYQIGVKEGDKFTYWQWVKNRHKQFEYSIIQLNTKTSYGTHFILADRNFNIFYDSMEGTVSGVISRHILYKII